MKSIGSRSKVTDIMYEMIERGLIIELKHGRYNVKTYELTDYGKNVFYSMDNLKRTLNGEAPRDDEISASSRGLQDITTK